MAWKRISLAILTTTCTTRNVASKAHGTKYAVLTGIPFTVKGANSFLRHFSRKSLNKEAFIVEMEKISFDEDDETIPLFAITT